MTDKPDLPPSSVAAFTEALKGGRGSLDAWLEVNDEREVAAHIEAYASACVSSATAEKDAEIDALRTRLEDTVRDSTNKIEALRAEVERSERYAEQSERERLWAEARAEQLAEALAPLPDDSGMIEHSPEEGPFLFCCGREVTYDRLHGPICTHDEDCWYARMRAMRDHDQEDRSDRQITHTPD